MIVFGHGLLERGWLKSCFKLGLKGRLSRYRKLEVEEFANSNKFRSSIISDTRAQAKKVELTY